MCQVIVFFFHKSWSLGIYLFVKVPGGATRHLPRDGGVKKLHGETRRQRRDLFGL